MSSKTMFTLLFVFATSLILSACGSAIVNDLPVEGATSLTESQGELTLPDKSGGEQRLEEGSDAGVLESWSEDVPRLDEQGAVTVELRPQNLNSAWTQIKFQVSMNTHSVELGMDLAALATLTTDTGFTVQADEWLTPQDGGHHVQGTLSFPSMENETPILQDARQITLVINGVDAPERIFIWDR